MMWLFIVLAVMVVCRIHAHLIRGVCTSKRRLDGKTVLITGANGGIGKVTAMDMARRGARLIMACRNLKTGAQARDEIVAETGNQNVILMKLDLSSQKSIREFAEEFLRQETQLDILIHNAGCAQTFREVTEDGLEKTMATNHFGPFLLTHLLIDLVKRSAPARIVVLASKVYVLADLDFNNVNPINSFPTYMYFVSKYANIYFTHELARRLEGTNVTVNCLHPGVIDTGIWRHVGRPLNWGLWVLLKTMCKTPEEGAQTTIHVAVAEEVEGITGKYFRNCKVTGLTKRAGDLARARKYWDLTADLVKLRPSDPKI